MTIMKLAQQFDNIIPNAVLWFTGEAEEDDSIYMPFDMDAYEDVCRLMVSEQCDTEVYEDTDMYMEFDIRRHVKESDDIDDDYDDDDDDDDDDGDDDDDDDDDDGDDDEDEYAEDCDGEEQEEEKHKKKIQVQHQNPVVRGNGVAAAPATGGAGGASTSAALGGVANQLKPMSLYIGDLDINVTDTQLYQLFNQVGQVISVRICRDVSTWRSLGYGFVNYSNPQDDARAMEMLDFAPVNGKSIRVKRSYRDPNFPKNRTANLFIRNLDKSIDNIALHDTFSSFGYIISCKVVANCNGQSKGYGFGTI